MNTKTKRANTHTHTHARTYAHTHAWMHANKHTNKYMQTYSLLIQTYTFTLSNLTDTYVIAVIKQTY